MNEHLLRFTCLHCLQPDGAELRVDKKNRPWTWCGHCRTRSFIHSASGLRGIRLVAPQLLVHYQQIMASLGEVDQQSQQVFDELRDRQVAHG